MATKKNTKATENTAPIEVKKNSTPATRIICLNFPHNIKFDVPGKNGKLVTYEFNGNANYLKGEAKGILPVGKYGYTFNVPAEVWEYISNVYKDMPLIQNGLMFAAEVDAAQESSEREELRSGLEPVDTKKKKDED